MQKTILLTGATGTCGSYLTKYLLKETCCKLILWVRQPEKLPQFVQSDQRVQIWSGGLQALPTYLEQLKQVQIWVHPVTSWGGEDCFVVNCKLTQALFNALDPEVCEQIHYFSTASLLDSNHQFRSESLQRGTEYIRSKAVIHQWLNRNKCQIPVSIYYPTLILGGENQAESGHPLTPLTSSLSRWPFYLRLLRYLQANAFVHFIHAEDIAKIICHRILNESPAQDLVLGNPAQSISDLMQELLPLWGISPALAQIKLERLLPILLPALSPWMTPWDCYSLTTLNTTYQSLSAESFGLASRFQKWTQVFQHLEISNSQ